MSFQQFFSQALSHIVIKDFNNAITLLKKTISLDSNFYPAYYELAKIYISQGKEDLAIILLTSGIEKNPDNHQIYLLLAEIYLQNLNIHIHDLIDLYETVISKGHLESLTFFRLAFLYNKTLQIEKANINLDKAYKYNINPTTHTPNNFALQYEIIDGLLFNFNFANHENFYEQYYEKLKTLPELQLQFVHKYLEWNNSNNDKIRLGFVSGDFRQHSVNFFFSSLLSHLDKDKYELYAFTTTSYEDKETQKNKELFDHWIPIRTDQSKKSAETIHSHKIDILFDLAGHTANNGLLIFKYKPAPIQVSWLGYFSSTGVPEMDYFITSPTCVHEDEHQFFTEKVIYLPKTYLCYDFSQHSIIQGVMPYDLNGYITFGFFQNLNKINTNDIQLWNEILLSVPNSKLIIKSTELSQENTKKQFLETIKHLPVSRIELRGNTGLEEHLRQHNNIDIMIDSINASGCTTTCQSLYMGVPILVTKGHSMLTRHGEQFMSALNLHHYIAENSQDFVNKVVKICNNIEDLRTLKSSLRRKVISSPIGNKKLFTRQWENLIDSLIVK
jgi:tetratricopeptide (TPR) repeat protein